MESPWTVVISPTPPFKAVYKAFISFSVPISSVTITFGHRS